MIRNSGRNLKDSYQIDLIHLAIGIKLQMALHAIHLLLDHFWAVKGYVLARLSQK